MNSAENPVSNAETNLLKKQNSSQEDYGVSSNDNLPNSTDLILNESSNEVKDVNNTKDSSGTEVMYYVNEGDSTIGNDAEVRTGNQDNNLPHTSMMLETDWGSKVYIVGTAHFSEESQQDVAKVIQAVNPNFVVLELCESRSYMLKWEENELLKIAEKMDYKMINETIRTYGVVQGAMYLLLLSVSAQITRELGMAPGGEFRRAYKEASNVPGCVVHLGDRPIEITLRRAFASMSWWQSIKFACYVIFSPKKINEEEIEKCKNRDYLEEMLGMFGGEFPELKNVFVNERDLFLSYSLLTASMLTTGPQGVIPNTPPQSFWGPWLGNCDLDNFDFFQHYTIYSLTHSNQGTREGKTICRLLRLFRDLPVTCLIDDIVWGYNVVGVVGMGHLAGIQRNWQKIDPMELRRVLQIPPPSRTSKIIKFSLKASFICLAFYGVHKLASKSQFYSSLFR